MLVKRLVALAAVFVLVAGISACGGGDEGSDSGGDTVTFGADTELSGNLQVYGLPAVQGLDAAVRNLNAAGGIKVGDKTYKAKVVEKDNGSDPSKVVTAARAVADAGAIAALGPDIGGPAAYNVWKDKLITFTPAFDLQATLQKDPAGNPLLFSPVPFLSNLNITSMTQIAAEFPDIKKVAILAPNNDEGKGSAAGYAAGAEMNGMKVVGQELFAPGATDFTSTLTKVKKGAPDLVIALQSPEEAFAIMGQAAQLKVGRYGLNDAVTPDQVLDAQGISGLTVLIPNFNPTYSQAATIPDYKPEVIFGKEAPKGNPGAAVAMYYAVQVTVKAMQKSGTTTDVKKIAAALPGQSYDGPFGTCTMTQKRDLQCETSINVIKGDDIKIYRFPNPSATKPSQVYDCKQGTCTPAQT